MAKCECGTDADIRPLISYIDRDTVGIPVVLSSVTERYCPSCKKGLGVIIPDPKGLVAAAAVARVKTHFKLEAQDIKFLRRALGKTAKDLADMLGVTPETFSRWENGKDPIGPANEKLLRLIVGLTLGSEAPAIRFDEKEIASMRIKSVRPADEQSFLVFKRVELVTLRKELEETWREDKKAA